MPPRRGRGDGHEPAISSASADLAAGTMAPVIPGRAERAVPLALYPPASPRRASRGCRDSSCRSDTSFASARRIELFLPRRRATLGSRARGSELAGPAMPPSEKRASASAFPTPSRTLAILHDRAANLGRGEAPPSSRRPVPGDASNGDDLHRGRAGLRGAPPGRLEPPGRASRLVLAWAFASRSDKDLAQFGVSL